MRRNSRKFRNLLTGEEIRAYQTTDHACSSYGQPVWVNVKTGEALDLTGMEPLDRHLGDCLCPACRGKHGTKKTKVGWLLNAEIVTGIRNDAHSNRQTITASVEAALKKYLG